jgi:hypothetical protein
MTLSDSPFWLLGASSRDNRATLLELSEELSSGTDAAMRVAARTQLTNPRQRLRAELRWLPGVSPSRATQLVEQATRGLADPNVVQGLLSVAAVNTVLASLHAAESLRPAELYVYIVHVFQLAEQVDPEAVVDRINEDRSVAGVPQIESAQSVRAEFEEWHGEILSSIATVLRRLTIDNRLETLTKLAEVGTSNGSQHGPLMLHECIDLLAIDYREPLTSRANLVMKECAVIRKMASFDLSEDEVTKQIEYLTAALQFWDSIAQPFQVSAHARGIEHEDSRELSLAVRSLAVDLHNTAGFTDASEHITTAMRSVFAEVGLVAARAEDDLAAIAGLREAAAKQEAERQEWEKSIQYEGVYGVVFKETVGVSAAGVRHNKKLLPLEDITRVRWGATRHSVNGIPTGTTYSILVGGERDVIQIECRREDVFNGATTALHRAVLWRLMVKLAAALRAGQQRAFGSMSIGDTGVWLYKDKFFSREQKFFPWDGVSILSENGSFVVRATKEKGFAGAISYLTDDNAHVAESLVRLLWKQGGSTLSGVVFDGESA